MSITRKVITALVAVSALTVMAPGHAETPTEEGQQEVGVVRQMFTGATQQVSDRLDALVDVITKPFITFSITSKDEDCLARNIYYEAASEPEEGKVAVGLVTINRVKDGRFANSICGVVNQRTVVLRHKELAKTEMVQKGWFGRPESVVKKELVVQSVPVCQFSWACAFVRVPKVTDERWEESKRIARAILNEEYPQWEYKYQNAMYFHATGIRPVWASQKAYVARIGGHKFYEDR
jgi:spore germination cell wall hydrolase CwlJ-like protein